MNITLNISKKVFNEVYYPYLYDFSRRYENYYGGAGSGKSVFVAQKLLCKACSSRRKVLVIRKVGRTIKDSVFELITSLLKKWGIWKYCKVNYSTFTIELPNSSIFLFKGMDDSEKIKSIADITDIWCEEATELSEDEYTQLDLRLRALAPNLQLITSFNPISKANWVYKKWFEDYKPRVDTLILRTTYKDNRFLPESYIKALEDKINTNPTYYKIYALGEFASLDKLVYNNWEVDDYDHKAIVGEMVVGLDFGFTNDISALVASIVDEKQKKIYIFREWGDTNKTNDELAAIITSLGFSKSTIIADSAEPKSIEELRRKGITRIKECTKGKDSILHGIQKLQQYKLVVHYSCTGIITELENYAWEKDKKTNEYINKPIDKFNHYLDSLRYSVQGLEKRKLQSMSKSSLGL